MKISTLASIVSLDCVSILEVVPWTPDKPHGFVIRRRFEPELDIAHFYTETTNRRNDLFAYSKNLARRFETEQEAQAMLLALKLSAE